jgi:hypothetical protein
MAMARLSAAPSYRWRKIHAPGHGDFAPSGDHHRE